VGAEQHRALREPDLLRPGFGECQVYTAGLPSPSILQWGLLAAQNVVHADSLALL